MILHILNQDEDLWYLAEYYYGDAALWDIIYYHNRAAIGDDPEDLQPGMQITIPALETGERILAPEIRSTAR